MQLVEHTVELDAEHEEPGRPSPDTAVIVLQTVSDLVGGAVNMAFFSSSRLRGRSPTWLRAAEDVRFVKISAGSGHTTCFHFLAPRFGEAVAELYQQGELFATRPAEGDTGFDLVGDLLADVRNEAVGSERFDTVLLGNVASAGKKLLRAHVTEFRVTGEHLRAGAAAALDATVMEKATKMGRQIPAPTRARLCGTLDMIRASDGAFELLLDGGERAHGLWTPADGSVLSKLWSQRVLIEGTAHFRPSGGFLRLETEVIRPAEDSDALFAVLPAAIGIAPPRLYVPARHAKLTVRDAWIGQWPGEETEEQLLAALREARV